MGPAPAVADTRLAVGELLADSAGPVLVACSGGADSLALAAALAFVAAHRGLSAGLITVDHGLQPGSAEQAKRVVRIGAELGLDPSRAVRVDVTGPGGPEAAARTARYAALERAARTTGARVLLGHTRDDQAETVLLGLGRGSGPRSIVGMAPADGRWLRPFLGLSRATTSAACEALGLTPWHDPHNRDPRFTRVRLRTEVLPLLEDVLHGGAVTALARTADLLRDDLEALDTWADAALASAMISGAAALSRGDDRDHREGAGGLRVDRLADLPRAVRTRVLRRWAEQGGARPFGAERSAELDRLVTRWRGQGPIELPGGVRVHRASGRLISSHRSDPTLDPSVSPGEDL